MLHFCKANSDNDASHFDQDVFWLHIPVKDPTAVKKEKENYCGKTMATYIKLCLLYNFMGTEQLS